MGKYIYVVDFKNYSMEYINNLTLIQLQKLINDKKIDVIELTHEQALYYHYCSAF